MRYEIKGPDGSGIIYIEDTKEYKIIVDAGDAIYVFDTPENAKLSDLTNFPGFSQDIKITEKEARDDMESQGILVKTNNEEFLSGFYKNDRYVHVSKKRVPSETSNVRGSNNCLISVFDDRIEGRIIISTSIDNLVKGSAGQAIQNMNIMFGLDEGEGLATFGLYP